MTNQDKIANIFTFLCILFGEKYELLNEIFDMSPDYIIEKYERYIESNRIEYMWGMHPNLRRNIFDPYIRKWKLDIKKEAE